MTKEKLFPALYHGRNRYNPFIINMRELVRLHQTILARKFVVARRFAWGFSITARQKVNRGGAGGIKNKKTLIIIVYKRCINFNTPNIYLN